MKVVRKISYEGFAKVAAKTGSPALAAWIGRKKYGQSKFQRAAAKGQSMRGMAAQKAKKR